MGTISVTNHIVESFYLILWLFYIMKVTSLNIIHIALQYTKFFMK